MPGEYGIAAEMMSARSRKRFDVRFVTGFGVRAGLESPPPHYFNYERHGETAPQCLED